jgi:hypothetical protein
VKRLLALAMVGLAAAIVVSAGAGADRRPVTMYGMTADGWGNSISHYDLGARRRWPGYERVWCRGVIIAGDRRSSSWVYGYARYWDKAFCVAMRERNSRVGTSFVLDWKSKERLAMYRVRPYSG